MMPVTFPLYRPGPFLLLIVVICAAAVWSTSCSQIAPRECCAATVSEVASCGCPRCDALDRRLKRLEEILGSDKLTLTSPDGKSTITLSAEDVASGLWIKRGNRDPVVAISNTEKEGAVLAVYGARDDKQHLRSSYDAALGAYKQGDGFLQMAGEKRGIFHLYIGDHGLFNAKPIAPPAEPEIRQPTLLEPELTPINPKPAVKDAPPVEEVIPVKGPKKVAVL